jgi:murein DD-endopeptidase MepM/ murein hydrolase activator NlpD
MRRFAPAYLIFLVLVLAPSLARAFELVAEPGRLKPGDPFIVKVLSNPHEPEAEVAGPVSAELHFTGCGDGCFVAVGAVDLYAGPGEVVLTVAAGGERKTLCLKVEEGKFPLQRLTLPENQVTLSPEDQQRADREAEMLASIWSGTSERLWEGGFIMPLGNGFSTAFGTRRIINGERESIHRGLDIRGKRGEEVKAANKGLVVLVSDTFYGGNTVVIDHGRGIYTIYMHMSGVMVMERELVSKGDVVGLVGSTGRSTGPHLHFGVKVGGVSTNPTAMTRLPL